MAMNFATDLKPSGSTRDLGTSSDKWDDLYVVKINGQDVSYYTDVVEGTDYYDFPLVGTAKKLYVDKTTNNVYRWNGSTYVQVGGGSPVAITNNEIDALFTTQS